MKNEKGKEEDEKQRLDNTEQNNEETGKKPNE